MLLTDKLNDVLDFTLHQFSDVLPSEWAEKRMQIKSGKFQGPLSYNLTPYTKEIADCFSPYHPANTIVLMGGSQVGKTKTIIEPAIAYHISEHPCNMGYLTGHSDLSEESMNKLDSAIDNAGLRPLIRANTLRKKNSRTGDTAKSKEFPNGSLISGSATNHKMLRQYEWRVIIADDIEAAKGASKESGSTIKMIEQRAASHGNTRKIFYCSTPELAETSIIEPLFLSGDQRRWHIPCQCCGTPIVLRWECETVNGDKAGMTWKVDNHGKLIKGSVGYICPHCGGFFTDRNKYEFNLAGVWIPTAEPDDETIVSFHLPSLYAPLGMFNWEHYVRNFIKANPPGQPQVEDLMKTHYNLCLGETFKGTTEAPQANAIQKNIRNYEIGTLPEKMSMADGNGRIVLLTCGADMNGRAAGINGAAEDDARLDYEVLAHTESGATYSILHGSIGTFIPRENTLAKKEDRKKWSYDLNVANSVWPEFEKILSRQFETDTGRTMEIMITGLDCGYLATTHAYPFLDSTNRWVIGLKGSKDDKYLTSDANKAMFKAALEKDGVYIPEVGLIKDLISKYMLLKWDGQGQQPDNFMNYPTPSDGLYLFANFFEHYEAEHRTVVTKDGNSKFRWVKKNAAAQNHLWDCRVYNIATKEIFLHLLAKKLELKSLTWREYVALLVA